MKVKMLMENTKKDCNLCMEHGLSIYIEACGHKILFDAGQSQAFAQNGAYMNVELSEIDTAILSHGHYDHSGGLMHFLEINQRANLYVNEYAFGAFYSGTGKEIGVDPSLKDHPQVIHTTDYTKLAEGLELFTYNQMERTYGSNSENLFVKEEEQLIQDSFIHEQYLLITEGEKRVLISGCSHKGIRNIETWVQPDVLIGGFHFKGIEMNQEGMESLDGHARYLQQFPTKYYTCHCTGTEQYAHMKGRMGEQVDYLCAGDELEL